MFLESLFAEQRGYVVDGSKYLAALCGRRSGKSYGNALRLKRAADRFPGEVCLYVSKTKSNSRKIVGRALMELSRKFDWGMRLKEIDGRLHALWPNGSQTWLAGAEHQVDFDLFRGDKFPEVQIDEAQLYPYLDGVINDVLEACVSDFSGTIVLSGTPAPVPSGFFHAITTGEGVDGEGRAIPKWPTHSWTVAENTFFQEGKGGEYREALRLRRGWDLNHPTLRREWFGEWVRDDGALIFPYDGLRNGWDGKLPYGEFLHVIAVDLGASPTDATTAFAVLAFRHGFPEVFVRESYKRAGMIPSKIAAELELLRQKYEPMAIVVDAGGLGGGYVEEFRLRYGIPAEPAKKADKAGRIELTRGDLRSGLVKINPFENKALLDEMALMQWDEDGTGFDDRFPDHLLDAWVYGHGAVRTYCRPFDGIDPDEGPPRNPADIEQEEHKAELEREILRRQRRAYRKGQIDLS